MLYKDKFQDEIKNIYANNLKNVRNLDKDASPRESYLNYTPNERSLYDQIVKVQDESKAALQEAKNALFEAKKAQDKADSLKWWVVALIVLLIIEFSSWLVSSLISFKEVFNNIDNYISELRIEQKEFEIKERVLEEKIDGLGESIDSKVELSVYKTLNELNKK